MGFGRVILVFACVATLDFAFAASQKDYDDCNSVDPDRRIHGCTVVIKDSKESQKNRAIASYQRGLGYERKGEFGAAIADFNEAIKLKIEGDNASKRRDYVSKKKEAIDRATPTLGSLDGTWEGELQSLNKDGTPAKPGSYRIVISGADAKVFILTDGKEREVKPTAFRVQRHLTNAVVLAIDSATDDDGLWVETWSFTVTLKDKNTLITNFSRVVNNANLPLSVDYSKFSRTASGEFQRK
jgi:hypothetical protein